MSQDTQTIEAVTKLLISKRHSGLTQIANYKPMAGHLEWRIKIWGKICARDIAKEQMDIHKNRLMHNFVKLHNYVHTEV